MKPTESGEMFWMLLSLLILPVEKQLEIIGELPYERGSLAIDTAKNPAVYLLDTLSEYYAGWLDEFYPNCPNAEALYSAINGGIDFKLSQKGFINDKSWNKLRGLAKLSLKEAGLDPFPVPERIDFNDYIEIIDE